MAILINSNYLHVSLLLDKRLPILVIDDSRKNTKGTRYCQAPNQAPSQGAVAILPPLIAS
jgi:hypothetical protein